MKIKLKRKTKTKIVRKFRITEQPHAVQTICELHRKMYRILMERNPDDPLIPILSMAFLKAKKMNNKLRQYKEDYDEGWWEVHRLDGGEIADAS